MPSGHAHGRALIYYDAYRYQADLRYRVHTGAQLGQLKKTNVFHITPDNEEENAFYYTKTPHSTMNSLPGFGILDLLCSVLLSELLAIITHNNTTP